MYRESFHETNFPPGINELTADATLAPESRSGGWFSKLFRQKKPDATAAYNDDEEEMAPNRYYVMPSREEDQLMYTFGATAIYGTEEYRDQYFADIRTCTVSETEDDDDRLYYKNFIKLEVDALDENEVKSEPHLLKTDLESAVCRNETGQCTCVKKGAGTLKSCKMECDQKPNDSEQTASKPDKEVCNAASAEKTDKSCSPAASYTMDPEEKLYISVDTHTDNTIVECRSIQTVKDEQNSSSATQTAEAETKKSSVQRTSNGNGGKRTYSILNGQRKSEENAAAIDKTKAKVKVKTMKSAKPEPDNRPDTSCSAPNPD